MDLDYRDIMIGAAVLVLATGTGLLLGQQMQSGEADSLYSESFNVTLTQSNNEETVEFDNRSVDLIYESWQEFRAYHDNGRYRQKINTTADNTVRTTTEIVTVDGASYRFRFRYRDDPQSFENDFLTLYRVERIQ